MEVIIIDSEAFEALKCELDEIVARALSRVLKNASDEDKMDWIPIDEAMKILPYRSKAKWQELRDRGKVTFSKLGRKILYSRKSLLAFVERNNIKAQSTVNHGQGRI